SKSACGAQVRMFWSHWSLAATIRIAICTRGLLDLIDRVGKVGGGFRSLWRSGSWEHAMSKAIAVLGSALFFVLGALVLAGFVPWWVTHWEFRPVFFGVDLTRFLGGILIIVGVPGLVDSFARFALEGLGTPAPIAPTQKLVVTGLYRYVRNPIYIAVVAVIFGQALLF